MSDGFYLNIPDNRTKHEKKFGTKCEFPVGSRYYTLAKAGTVWFCNCGVLYVAQPEWNARRWEEGSAWDYVKGLFKVIFKRKKLKTFNQELAE